MQYQRAIEVARDPATVFSYLADFANCAEWDPGVAEARRLSPAPTAVGSRFEVIGLFRGRRHRFDYVVTAYEDGQRIELRGEGDKARSDDVIAVAPAGTGARVSYRADVRLKGVYRVTEPFLSSKLRHMADEALDGLKATLDPAAQQ